MPYPKLKVLQFEIEEKKRLIAFMEDFPSSWWLKRYVEEEGEYLVSVSSGKANDSQPPQKQTSTLNEQKWLVTMMEVFLEDLTSVDFLCLLLKYGVMSSIEMKMELVMMIVEMVLDEFKREVHELIQIQVPQMGYTVQQFHKIWCAV